MADSTTKNSPKRMALVGLAMMPQLVEMQDPEDDWTGKTKAADRRKRQNRLNQRAYRRRKQLERGRVSELPDSLQAITRSGSVDEAKPRDGYVFLESPSKRAFTITFMQNAYLQYSLKSPKLSSLPALIRLNALNAIAQNAETMGFPREGLCCDDWISPFNEYGPDSPDKVKEGIMPESLRPTALQRMFVHHPWTDLFPLPRLRDNILYSMMTGTLDEDELCLDLLDVIGGYSDPSVCLIVWGKPSDIAGWEVSPGFLKKWGWLLQGCPEAIEATNRWRESRGESRLNVKV